ncbi:MAG: hypothetical protein HOM58_22085 [Rhodospirillaceae bacterium]|jgi:2,3-dihydroxyphenylpropionate 1,2-dioxygenase|nr:hypothetical protein [Rhodospirillaceae bacterium]MBT5457880.1 hypothetical protein [Rhodospirillaceae bacterium]
MTQTGKKTGVIGGVCTAHAPQLWTRPDSEDPAVIERMHSLLQGVGDKLKALKPDVCIVVANDHAQQFLLHCTASFTMHIGAVAEGSFAGRDYSYEVASESSLDLLRYVQRQGFDPAFTSTAKLDYAFGIPLDFTGMDVPIIPIFVNAYVPPQPSMERCHAFGRAIADGVKALGLRAIVVCSGGLSHYPGTMRYAEPGPDTAFDEYFMGRMAAGETRYLLALNDRKLDETGNIELRCWGAATGMIGERAADLTNFEPTWHHNYGTAAWTNEASDEAFEPHYPHIHPDRVVLSETLHRLAGDAAERDRYLADPTAYAASIEGLAKEEQDALIKLDQKQMIDLGMHPFVPHAFRRVLERAGILEAPAPKKQ